MPLEVLKFPHPTLRHVAKPLRRVDAQVHHWAQEMLQRMYAHNGVGMAATQVDLPYRMFVVNPEGDAKARDQEFVFINPVITSRKGTAEAEEGCLSLPGLYGQVKRSERVTLDAYTLAGEEVSLPLDGLFARVVQHEIDHLDGILFIDRLSATGVAELRESLELLAQEFARRREHKEIPDDAAIAARLAELERERA